MLKIFKIFLLFVEKTPQKREFLPNLTFCNWLITKIDFEESVVLGVKMLSN